MAEPFVGEIRTVGFNFAPQGWALCNGQLMAIADSEVLFNLIGTTYGGDGQTTFALPNMQGRIPIHIGGTHSIGESGGAETASVTTGQLPSHTHALTGSAAAAVSRVPDGNVPATAGRMIYGTGAAVPMAGATLSPAGGTGSPHDNMQPFLCVNFIISLFGIFPSQN